MRRTLPLLALVAALAFFGLVQLWALAETGGRFEYPLDDPYIHLAIADVITKGGYGVNPGELSSPGSSALFPLLLTPFAGSEAQRYLPLLWNTLGLAALGFLWGRMLVEAGYGRRHWRWLGVSAAVVGPVALMMPQVAMVGMEHTLHTAATLAVIVGLMRHVAGRPGGIALVLIGVLLAASFRFEAAALGLLAAGLLALTGAVRAGVATAVLTLLPLALFVGALLAMGLDPMPSSIQTKLALVEAESQAPFAQRLAVLGRNLREPGGLLLLALAVVLFVMSRRADLARGWQLFALALAGTGLAHLAFGQIGWLDRYEHYALVALAAGVLTLIARLSGRIPGRGAIGGVAAVLVAGLIAYQPSGTRILPESARAIGAQQGEMARFAQEFLNAPVAVNDLGRVTWRNSNYVYDLWGLANPAAREAMHAANGAPGWAGPIVAAKGVPVAMIYDNWIKDGIGADWVRVGRLSVTETGGFLGGYIVSFYATAPEHVAMTQTALAAWEPTLGPGTIFVFDEGMGP